MKADLFGVAPLLPVYTWQRQCGFTVMCSALSSSTLIDERARMSAGLSNGASDTDWMFKPRLQISALSVKHYSGRFAPRNTLVKPEMARSVSPSVRM